MTGFMGFGASIGPIATNANNIVERKHADKLSHEDKQTAYEMWALENSYNTPAMQRKRLEMAGLNPALVYGSGTVANTASSVSVPRAHEARTSDPGASINASIGNLLQSFKTNSDIGVAQKSVDVMDADIANKNASSTNLLANAAQTDQQRDQAGQLFTTVADQARANLVRTGADVQKTVADTDKTVQETAFGKQLQPAVKESANLDNAIKSLRLLNLPKEQDANMQKLLAEIAMSKRQYTIAEMDAKLAKAGLTRNDPTYYRALYVIERWFKDNWKRQLRQPLTRPQK